MKLTEISNELNDWLDGDGPHSDIVISSRIRLARNLAEYKFLSRCSNTEKSQILERLKEVITSIDIGENIFYISIDQANELDRNFLVERHLISRHHALGKGPRGAVISRKESFTAMINEEDHLRIQVIKGGLQLGSCWEQINRIDDMIEQQVDYAFSPKYGYLTACPTNLGTGVRVSVMLHLPALKITGQVEKLLGAARDMNLAVRGLFGEGTEATGDFYQVSNQVSLGVREDELVSKFEKLIIPSIVEYERAARGHLLASGVDLLEDKISRATAVLKNARLISSEEALILLSHLRLGINMHEKQGASTPAIEQLCGLKDSSADSSGRITVRTINKLFLLTLPAHLQLNYGKPLDPTHRDVLRANIIRKTLNQ